MIKQKISVFFHIKLTIIFYYNVNYNEIILR